MIKPWVIAALLWSAAACGDKGAVRAGYEAPAAPGRTLSEQAAFETQVSWVPEVPHVGQEGHARITLVDHKSLRPAEAHQVQVTLLMPAHGHPGRGTPVVHVVSASVYEVSNIVPTMSGTWELTVHATLGDALHADIAHVTFAVDK